MSCQPKDYFFLQNSGIEKAFLFDVVSKIYVATDRYVHEIFIIVSKMHCIDKIRLYFL